jgi:hypothetical protein
LPFPAYYHAKHKSELTMKVTFLFAAFAAATAQAFAPSSSFTPVVSINNARTSGSALSMAMERTYIMVSCQKKCL